MRYGIGDIVQKNTNVKMEYFIIVDVFLKFTKETTNLTFGIDEENTVYTAVQIYPVEHEGSIMTFKSDKVNTVAFLHQKQNEVILEMVERKRKEQGMNWEAEYIKTIQAKTANNGFKEALNTSFNQAEVKPKKKRGRPKKLKDKDDVVEYHKLETIDDCLDALNSLSALHKMFGDESYIQLKEVVTNRLKELC